LLNQLTVDGIRLGGISQRRNPYLAALIMRARGRESLGLGIPSMLGLVEDAGLPSPAITVGNGEFRIAIWFARHGGEPEPDAGERTGKGGDQR
jgi:ATP-dependent DNA helicase RecG